MIDIINKWGALNLHHVLSNVQEKFIHPDDLALFGEYPFITSLHKCVGVDDDYAILEFGDVAVRVLKDLFCVLKESIPKFKPLEKVKYLSSKGKLEYGKVIGIHWHNRDNKYYYDIEVNGRKKSRHYHDEDLQKVEELT